MAHFSSEHREKIIQELEAASWDLIVIGGGITGAGIALDAQTRGLRVALIEMQDFAAGTSSRSTKLVHGGLRYLKQFEIGVVAEVGKERAIVYENGPHVTTPEWMLLPLYEGGTFGKFTTSLGLRVYDFLAGVRKNERRKMLTAAQTLEKEPLLKHEGLKGGGYYVEYRTDDARLTMEVVKAAVAHGTRAINYMKAEQLLYDQGRVVGVVASDQISGKQLTIEAANIVNATGPWVDQVRELDRSKQGNTLHITKGVHLVINNRRFPLRQAVYFDTPDGRMVFAIPRDGVTYVGTTDTNYQGDLRNPVATTEDREYILAAVNGMFPTLALTSEDVESSWAGLRPLIHQEGKGPSEISRRDEIFVSASGLISIAGGKLTGYRKMAASVVDLVATQIGEQVQVGACSTEKLPISGGDVGGSERFSAFVAEQTRVGVQLGLSQEAAIRLARRYGSNADQLWAILQREPRVEAATGLPLELYAMLVYSIEQEMAVTPVDFFVRRTGALFFDIHWVREWKQPVIDYMAERLGWNGATRGAYNNELERAIAAAAHA